MEDRIDELRSKVLALASKYDRTEVAEYEGQLHVRCGRKVVCVVDWAEGTLRVNCIETPEQRSRVNDVLAILEVPGREAVILEATVQGAPGITVETPAWKHVSTSEFKLPCHTKFQPRETFTFAYLDSPYAADYSVESVEEDEDGAPVYLPQPRSCWIQDNLRDISEVTNA